MILHIIVIINQRGIRRMASMKTIVVIQIRGNMIVLGVTYTTDPDVEWEYCDVPFCPLEPTISPAPTLTKLPSESPTLSVSPSTLPSSSGLPSLSVSPSTLPSVSPTYTGGCMNLSIAVLFPAQDFF